MHAEMGCRYAAPLGGARTTIVFNGNVFKHQGLQRRHAHGQVPKQLTGFFQRCNVIQKSEPRTYFNVTGSQFTRNYLLHRQPTFERVSAKQPGERAGAPYY